MKKHRSVSILSLAMMILGLLFLLFLIYHASEIEGKDWGQIILMMGLVVITALYADSTEKMAQEMKEQRFDSARPIMDVVPYFHGESAISAGLAAESGDYTWGLSCKLHNIGLGPAVDVYSYVQFQRKSLRIDFGTIATKDETKKEETLSVFQEDGHLVLKVYYKDIYGRNFESSRAVQIGEVTSSAESGLGPLKSILVEEHKE